MNHSFFYYDNWNLMRSPPKTKFILGWVNPNIWTCLHKKMLKPSLLIFSDATTPSSTKTKENTPQEWGPIGHGHDHPRGWEGKAAGVDQTPECRSCRKCLWFVCRQVFHEPDTKRVALTYQQINMWSNEPVTHLCCPTEPKLHSLAAIRGEMLKIWMKQAVFVCVTITEFRCVFVN